VVASKAEDEMEEEEGDGSFTLFVKNLNFATTEEALRQAFEKRTKGVRTVAIPKKTGPPAKVTTRWR
jgi:RNA recognition motif-containing protein